MSSANSETRVGFTKADILETRTANIFCDEPGCSESYSTPAGLKWHKGKYHDKGGVVDVVGDELTKQDEEAQSAETEMDEERLSGNDDGMFLTERKMRAKGGIK